MACRRLARSLDYLKAEGPVGRSSGVAGNEGTVGQHACSRSGLKSKTGAFKRAIKELLESGLIAYTLPDRPNSRLQQYRLTRQGQLALMRHKTAIEKNRHRS